MKPAILTAVKKWQKRLKQLTATFAFYIIIEQECAKSHLLPHHPTYNQKACYFFSKFRTIFNLIIK